MRFMLFGFNGVNMSIKNIKPGQDAIQESPLSQKVELKNKEKAKSKLSQK